MRIERITCENYKSLRAASLDGCESLNILIGKNNAGKSNLLKAIRAFHSYVSPTSFVTILTQADVERSLFQIDGTSTTEASISATMALTEAEKSTLIEDIAREAPQVKNALAALDPTMRVRIQIVISSPERMAYVKRVELVDIANKHAETILHVPPQAATELRSRAVDIKRLEREIQAFESLQVSLNEYLSLSTGHSSERSYAIRSLVDRYSLDRTLRAEIMDMLESTTDNATLRQIFGEQIARRRDAEERSRNSKLSKELTTFAGNEGNIPSYVVSFLEKVQDWRILYLDETRKPVGSDEARRLLSLKMRRGGGENLQAIQSAVSGLLGVQIDAFESDVQIRREGAKSPLAEMDVDNFLVQVNGSGIRESLRLILDINFENPHTLLLEEPEVHLHPALEYSLLQYLKDESENRQIFITTHSTNFLDTVGSSRIFLVSKDTETRVSAVSTDELADKIPREIGVRLSSVFMFDRLIFVEGPSDELILREFASKMDLNFAVSGVGFVQTRGARSFSHFANAETMDILSSRQVKSYFLLDRDERSTSEIESMQKLCEGKAFVYVWKKREIENYLLDAMAVASLISIKSEGKIDPPEAEVSQEIDSAIEELRTATVSRTFLHKNCSPLHFDFETMKASPPEDLVNAMSSEVDRLTKVLTNIRQNLTNDHAKIAEEIDHRWSSASGEIVPGADVLDLVLRKYGLRYRKSKDGVTLAKLIPVDKLDPEIRTILRDTVQ